MPLPPYAKELAQARRQGLVPAMPMGWFMVALGWTVHRRFIDSQETFPRVVLPLDVAIQDYDLRPLAGLDLLLVYDKSDGGRVQEVADCLLAIKPRTLTAWGIPVEFGNPEADPIIITNWQARGETLLPGVREPWA